MIHNKFHIYNKQKILPKIFYQFRKVTVFSRISITIK